MLPAYCLCWGNNGLAFSSIYFSCIYFYPTLLLPFQLRLVLERPLTIKKPHTLVARTNSIDGGDDISTIDNIQCH